MLELILLLIAVDPMCFIETSAGEVRDLSGLCGHSQTPQEVVTESQESEESGPSPDEQFLEALLNYEDTTIVQAAQAHGSEQALWEGQNVCTQLEAGLSLEDIQADQAQRVTFVRPIGYFDVVRELAVEYLCFPEPEVASDSELAESTTTSEEPIVSDGQSTSEESPSSGTPTLVDQPTDVPILDEAPDIPQKPSKSLKNPESELKDVQ